MSFAVPPLSIWQAHSLAAICATSYVGVLYVSQNTRISYSSNSLAEQAQERQRRRDDPDVIRARVIAVSLSTALSCGLLAGVVRYMSSNEAAWLASAATRLGFTVGKHIIFPSLIAPVLYLGPLFTCHLSRTLPFQRNWSFEAYAAPVVKTWKGWRNCILAPITEEIAFRSCILAFYHMAGVSSMKLIFLSPLWFGLAHVHHGVETYHRLGSTPLALQTAITHVLVHVSYTTLFGFHCAYLFLKTGSIVPSILSHMFCNFMGLPTVGWDMSRFPQQRVAIIATHVIGIVGYIFTLSAWTKGANSIYWALPGQANVF